MAATGVFGLTRFTALASGDVIPAVDISDPTQNAHGSLDAITVTNFFATVPVPVNVTSASATALAVGRLGATTPAFTVDSSTASQVAGLKVVGAVTTGTVAIVVTDSGAVNTNLTVNALGAGTIGIGSVSTGRVTITPATTITGALTQTGLATFNGGATIASGQTLTVTGATITGLTAASVATGTFPGVYTITGAVTLSAALTYGGVTLSNAVTGTGNMVLSASPTLTGTVTTAALSSTTGVFSGAVSATQFSVNANLTSGRIYKDVNYGVTTIGVTGVSYDWSVWNAAAGAIVMANLTGTNNIVFNGALSGITTLAGNGAISGFTTVAFSGQVTSSKDGRQWLRSGASTNSQYFDLVNTGGEAIWGVEASTGGAIFTGSSAYATVAGSAAATATELATSGTVRLSISSAGAFDFKSNPLSGITTLAGTGAISGFTSATFSGGVNFTKGTGSVLNGAAVHITKGTGAGLYILTALPTGAGSAFSYLLTDDGATTSVVALASNVNWTVAAGVSTDLATITNGSGGTQTLTYSVTRLYS